MFGRLISALMGHAAARQAGVGTGAAGMILGTAIPFVARRFGPLGMIGLMAGAWAVRRLAARPVAQIPAPAFDRSVTQSRSSPN